MAWGQDNPRILICDIEISHDIIATYGLREQYHGHHSIIQNWFMICFAWMWLDGEGVQSRSLLSDPKRFKKDHTDDEYLITELHKLLSRADIVVGHNFNRFDWKKFMSKVIKYGLPPIAKPVMIDTLTEARKLGAFTSNSLAYLVKFLKVEHMKQEHAKDMWFRILLHGCKKAIKECVTYCKGDIVATRDLYLKLRPYIESHPNWNLWRTGDEPHCKACGSDHMNKHKVKITRAGKYMQWQCQVCGAITAGVKRIRGAKFK